MDSAHVIAWCEREKRKVAGVSWPKEHLEVRPDGKRGRHVMVGVWSIVRRRIGCTRYDVCAQPNNPANGPLDVAHQHRGLSRCRTRCRDAVSDDFPPVEFGW